MRGRRGRASEFVDGAFWTALGAAFAFLGLAISLNVLWMIALALATLALLIGSRLILVLTPGLTRVYREIRRARTRIPIQPITKVDPTRVGVDRPALQALPGGHVPPYQPRNVDGELRAAIEDGLRGDGPWIVVASGRPKVGKSRSLFEALRHTALDGDLEFVAPIDADALRNLAERSQVKGRGVLWLDDLEPFLNQGVTVKALQDWHRAVPEGIVAATYGGKGGEPRQGDSGALAEPADEMLEHARSITVRETTEAELDLLRPAWPQHADLAEERGLGAYLTAATALVDRMSSPEGAKRPDGVAVVQAAIDWVRCGRTDPLPKEVLREVWPSYQRADTPETSGGFEEGLEWALRPTAEGVAPVVQRSAGYVAAGYLVGHFNAMPEGPPPPDVMWAYAMSVGSRNAEALAVGARAYAHGSYRNALASFRIASRTRAPWLAAAATFDIGVTLDRLERPEEAIPFYERVIDRDESEQVLRRLVAKAAVNRGFALIAAERIQGAIEGLNQALMRYGASADLQPQIARALLGLGKALGETGEFEQAIGAYDEVLARFGTAKEPGLREQVGLALVEKGMRLSEMGRFEEAMEAYEEAISRYEETSSDSAPKLVAQARFQLAVALASQGRSEEAIAVFESIATQHGDAPDPELRELAERAIAGKRLAIGGLKRTEGGQPGDTEVIERANVAIAEGLREDFKRNLREPVRITALNLHGLDFFTDSRWELHPSVNLLLGRNGYGKSLLLRILAGMLQRDVNATAALFDEDRPEGRIELDLVRSDVRGKIERDRSVFLRGSLGKVPILAIPDARFMDRSTTTLSDFEALNLATDGANHYLAQVPYRSAVEGLLSGLALDYWQHETFDLPTFNLINDVLHRLTDRALEFRKIERVGRTGSRIWVRTEGLDRDLEIQRASQGTLSIIAIFGLIHAFLQELARERGRGETEEVRNEAAIVLIDEVDAHLHPTWQQKVRNTLVEIFPNVQFLLTAHSPLIVAGCGPGEVSVLRRSEQGHAVQELNRDFVGASVQHLYKEIFDIEDLDETFLRYARLEATGEASEIGRQLDELLEKEHREGLSSEEKVLSERLMLERMRLERVQTVQKERQGAETRELEQEAEITRLKGELDRSDRDDGELAE